jgi:arylformamidase
MNILPKSNTVHDISILLGAESIDYPGGTPPYARETKGKVRGDKMFRVSKLEMSAHAGTHIDAPSHLIPNTKSLDQYEIQHFILSAVVVDVEDRETIQPSAFEDLDIKEGDAILFRTNNPVRAQQTSGSFFNETLVYVTNTAADLCVKIGVKLVGIDYFSTALQAGSTNPMWLFSPQPQSLTEKRYPIFPEEEVPT